MKNTNKHSSYWAGVFTDKYRDPNATDAETASRDLIRLSSYKRAISNFVTITTNQNIPVVFDTRGGSSYTDGKMVVLSAKMDDKDFDSTVGLALHEGSHIKLTDFDILKRLNRNSFPLSINYEFQRKLMDKYKMDSTETENYIKGILKNILNVVEDRRIDNYIHTAAPGYNGYYQAMYDRYFNDKLIDKALGSSSHRELDWDSYMFRFINIINKNRVLDALPGFKDVFNLLDLGNISRLHNTTDAYELSGEIFVLIENQLPATDGMESGSESGSEPDSNSDGSDGSDDTDDTDGDSDGSEAETVIEGSSNEGGSATPAPDLTDRQEKLLEKQIKKQKDFQNSEIKKSKLSKEDEAAVETLSNAGITQEVVGKTYNHHYRSKPTSVYIINNFTKSLIDSNQIGMCVTGEFILNSNQINIQKGVQLGTLLGRRLKVRAEEQSLFTTRLKSGRLDRRLVNELGHGNTQIFSTMKIEHKNNAHIHISIDASQSMSGHLFNSAQITAVAIAKAASMTKGMEVVISYRTTKVDSRKVAPMVLIAYDSRKDKFAKITSLFKYLKTSGTTPEGLCYEAIKKQITDTAVVGTDSYLLNISDGMPQFRNTDLYYGGWQAMAHTKEQMDSIKRSGINILSYFVSDYGSTKCLGNFKSMYGKSAEAININQLIPLAKSLNKMFE